MCKDKPIILVVDDNFSNLILLENILADFYNIVAFSNPYKVLSHLKETDAHLIISDLVMPEMNGIELFQEIKKEKPDLPFIILSAYDKDPDIIQAYEKGIHKYLVKPVNIPELMKSIEDAINKN
ncbi:MAG: response regulator [Bacteroidales bacterium]